MDWIIALHIISFVCWYAGLFYLPRLFVYHAMAKSTEVSKLLVIMERKLFYYIMTPAMIATLITGFILLSDYLNTHAHNFFWLRAKLVLVLFLIFYHVICGYYLLLFKMNRNSLSHKFYRYFNEIPSVLLVLITILAVVKPF